MTVVMGILNVTPDSFSDGGSYLDPALAIAHARALVADGADIIDVGGESTRPGAERVSVGDELARVLPVVRALAAEGVSVSVDTMRAEVAEKAVAAGAVLINDVSGGLADPALLRVAADYGVDVCLMHWRGHSAHMQDAAVYDDVVRDVADELLARRDAALAAGVAEDRIILDPGIGFAKTWDHNWELLGHLDRFVGLGHRVIVGTSRKAFLGGLLDGRPAKGRDAATAALTFWSALHGVWAVRTHEVRMQADAIAVASRLTVPDLVR